MTTIEPLKVNQIKLTVEFLAAQGQNVTAAQLDFLISKNPGLSQAAFLDSGEVVGVVLVSYDGISAYYNKLAVKEEFRGAGLGKQLLANAEAALIKAGCFEIRINCHEYLSNWYESQNFIRSKSVPYVKVLKPQADVECGENIVPA